jgi:hypothetical protein
LYDYGFLSKPTDYTPMDWSTLHYDDGLDCMPEEDKEILNGSGETEFHVLGNEDYYDDCSGGNEDSDDCSECGSELFGIIRNKKN